MSGKNDQKRMNVPSPVASPYSSRFQPYMPRSKLDDATSYIARLGAKKDVPGVENGEHDHSAIYDIARREPVVDLATATSIEKALAKLEAKCMGLPVARSAAKKQRLTSTRLMRGKEK